MIYDISPPLTAATAVWPGDTPLRREVLLDMRRGANVTLSSLHASGHLGAHADGECHYSADGPGVEARPLGAYLGPCRLVAAVAVGKDRVGQADLDLDPAAPLGAARVLIRTGTSPDPEEFRRDFAGLEPALVDWLHDRGVRLIGVDTPSVDPFDSADLPAHRALLRHGLAVLEGLALAAVPPGLYELIALPLPLTGFDASPVRAVLRTLDELREGEYRSYHG